MRSKVHIPTGFGILDLFYHYLMANFLLTFGARLNEYTAAGACTTTNQGQGSSGRKLIFKEHQEVMSTARSIGSYSSGADGAGDNRVSISCRSLWMALNRTYTMNLLRIS